MDTEVYTVRPETEIMDAVGFLLKHRVTGAPVVDEAGHLLGMLSEKDCLKLLTIGADGGRPHGVVADFMSTALTTISPDTDVYYAAGLFLNSVFRRLPVVEGGKVVGAITRFDLLRVIHAKLS
jgi:CBS domain-containing protein